MNEYETIRKQKINTLKALILLNVFIFTVIIILIISIIHIRNSKNKDIISQLEAIEINIQNYIESNDYEKAILEINKMEILENLSDSDKKIWIKNRDFYLDIINNKFGPL